MNMVKFVAKKDMKVAINCRVQMQFKAGSEYNVEPVVYNRLLELGVAVADDKKAEAPEAKEDKKSKKTEKKVDKKVADRETK